jgi:hypothetical protein
VGSRLFDPESFRYSGRMGVDILQSTERDARVARVVGNRRAADSSVAEKAQHAHQNELASLLPGSSMVERSAVNRNVRGSSPLRGANLKSVLISAYATFSASISATFL